ncbi:YidC/Oxa1 family membrane protein insertase [Candidatus Gracilibacteria bacterium]|nr:YidC/Oxa1 family membrane protein insertase [Candidatus Gracilibacteria bacterium]
MKKYLDILIFTILFFLLFSYFTGKDTQVALDGIEFNTSKNSYKVPAGIITSVTNNTSETMNFNTCENISIRQDGDIVSLPSETCMDVELTSGKTYTLDLASQYSLFEEPGNYVFSLNYDDKEYVKTLDIKYRGTIGKVFVGLFYAPLYNLMAYLIGFFSNSLGMAIVAITILIRILLLFPQHKMLVSQRKMQAIQPKIKKLQEKHKGNQQVIGAELMKLYKQEGVSPMGACAPLLIQMPILIVIYNIIMNITSLKNEFYLYEFLQGFHISQIEFNFFGMDLLQSGGVVGACLALSVAAIQYIQVRLSLSGRVTEDKKSGVVLEKKKGAEDYNSLMPDPEMMNKFMLYGMPVMVGVFTFFLIAGVGLYWGISTLFAIFQQLFVNKIIKK